MESHTPIRMPLMLLVSIAPWSRLEFSLMRDLSILSLIFPEIGSLQRSLLPSWGETAVTLLHFGFVGVLAGSEAFSVAAMLSSPCRPSIRPLLLGSGDSLQFIVPHLTAGYCD